MFEYSPPSWRAFFENFSRGVIPMNAQYRIFLTLMITALIPCANASEEKTSSSNSTEIIESDDPMLNESFLNNHTVSKNDASTWSPQQSKQAELEAQYLKEIKDNPDNKATYRYLAGLYLSNNKTDKAIAAYQEAIIHNPDNAKLFAAMSIAYLHQTRFAMAKAMADEALRLDPSLQQVKKIHEYIDAKIVAINSASKVDINKTDRSDTTTREMPKDLTHGHSDNALNISDPAEWVKSE